VLLAVFVVRVHVPNVVASIITAAARSWLTLTQA
jgi:hypothetical protein